jgi:hypothetical protein
MASTMMTPTGMTMPGMMPTGMTMPGMGTPTTMGPMMVPRCTIKLEKCTGGMKMSCSCDDSMAAKTLQELCRTMAGTMCSCCCTMNGMMMCCCNLTMGICKCENTKDGVTISCVSGDKDCCAMIQACCDCLAAMTKSGCTCYVMMNNMPICCGC